MTFCNALSEGNCVVLHIPVWILRTSITYPDSSGNVVIHYDADGNVIEKFMDPLVLAAKNYSPIFIGSYDVGPREYVGSKQPTTCRFCQKIPPEVTFKKEAHAISQLLGNRQLVVTDECDACNELFSRSIEDHLGKYTKPYRVMAAVRGQNGMPAYKTRKRLWRWIGCEDHTRALMKPLKLLLTFVPGFKPFRKTSIMVLRKNLTSTEEHLPYCLLLLAFGNLQYQIMVPSQADYRADGQASPEGRKVDFTVPRIPTDFGEDWPFGPPEPATVDLSSGEPVDARPFKLSLNYESVDEMK